MSKSDFWTVPNYMNVTGNSTAINIGAPIGFKPYEKLLTINSVNYLLTYPGFYHLDLEEFLAQMVVTTENGTDQTVDLELQGTFDPFASYTQINLEAGYDDDDTSIVVDDGASIGSGAVVVPVLFVGFESSGDVRRPTYFEWGTVTNVSTNTLTVSRGAYGTSGHALSNNDFVFFTHNWATLKDSAGNSIMLNDFASNGATATAPLVGQIQLSAEGLDMFQSPFIRFKQSAPNDGGITYHLDLSGRTRAA
jgi:hypothetical protein